MLVPRARRCFLFHLASMFQLTYHFLRQGFLDILTRADSPRIGLSLTELVRTVTLHVFWVSLMMCASVDTNSVACSGASDFSTQPHA